VPAILPPKVAPLTTLSVLIVKADTEVGAEGRLLKFDPSP